MRSLRLAPRAAELRRGAAPPAKRRVGFALALGLSALAAGIGLTLAHAPTTVARSNRAPVGEQLLAGTRTPTVYCQGGELLPRGTSALRIWLSAVSGPRVTVAVTAQGRSVTGGSRGSEWIGGSVTVPVRPLSYTVSGASVCVSFAVSDETVYVQGNRTPPASATREEGQPIAGRMWIEYLHPGARSWASLISSTARRLGLGRAFSGLWVVFFVLALLSAIVIASCGLVLRELH
jgi:hypothetical protein